MNNKLRRNEMRKNAWIKTALVLTALILCFTTAKAQVSFELNIGSGGYYQPVGDYDYLPYAYQMSPNYQPPRINFHDMMDEYGFWVNVEPFGQVWRPYTSNDWRPYTYGHWIYTQQYGQMWEGYEPWAWVGYHYGNWIFSREYGWVWIPGYDWNPGRVIWARSYGSIGWMPEPPQGYDYSRGYLSMVGSDNQFTYNDDDFGADFGRDNYGYGGPYYNPRYRDMYYNPAYTNVTVNLWVFVDDAHYGSDNYGDYYLGGDYTQHVFDRKLVRISNRPIERPVLERLLGRNVQEAPIEVRQIQTDKQAITVVVPTGSVAVDRIRNHSNEVVRDVIAPGFVEKKKDFRGQKAGNRDVVSKMFGQENVKPKIEAVSSEKIINQANAANQNRERNRKTIEQTQKETLIKIEKDGKVQQPANNQDQQQSKQTQKQADQAKQQVIDKNQTQQQSRQAQKQADQTRQSDQAKQQLRDNNQAQKQADQSQKQADQAQQQSDQAQKQADQARQQSRQAQKQVNQAQQQSDQAKQQSDQIKQRVIDKNQGQQNIKQAQQQSDQAQKQANEAQQQSGQAKQQLKQAQKQADQSQKQADQSQQQSDQAQKQANQAQQQADQTQHQVIDKNPGQQKTVDSLQVQQQAKQAQQQAKDKKSKSRTKAKK
jgi:hypothetical protein